MIDGRPAIDHGRFNEAYCSPGSTVRWQPSGASASCRRSPWPSERRRPRS